ncbi:pilin [Lysobacter terrae]
MTQWHYADDAGNRVGPISSEELREHYRQRRLRLDSLVWSEGMVQWLPLERLAIELDIDSITPDATPPPPLPTGPAAPVQPTRAAAPPKKGMSGCMIALLVCAALAIPMVGILAAIAIPAYQDYVQRAKVAEVMIAAVPLKTAIAEHMASEGNCPNDQSGDLAAVLAQLTQHPRISGVRVGTVEGGHCAFEITLRGPGAVEGKTLMFETDADASQWDCSGGDLPARFRPIQCRATSTPT